MADEDNIPSEEILSRAVPIRHYGTEDVLGIFADQAIVSHSTGLFTLLFFQLQFPPAPNAEILQQMQELPARCVTRIILTPQLMQQFADAINENLVRYKRLTDRASARAQEAITPEPKETQ